MILKKAIHGGNFVKLFSSSPLPNNGYNYISIDDNLVWS